MNEVMSASDSRLLLIRIRPARETPDNAGQKLSLEAEAIVNYESIYPSAPFDIDFNQLQSSIASPNNQYGQLLGAQLCTRAFHPASSGEYRTAGDPTHAVDAGRFGSARFNSWSGSLPLRPGDPIAIRRDTPFSRYAAVDLPENTAPEDTRFHLLVAVASPGPDEVGRFEVTSIDVEVECSFIVDACQDLLRNGQMQLTLMPGKNGLPLGFADSAGLAHVRVIDGFTTAERIADSLDTVHGLHIIAHGRQGKRFNLVLEDENLGMLARPDTQLIEFWQPERLRLIFLQSCQSAAPRSANDPRPFVSGFMRQLVHAGVPAVVAMQDFVRMVDAREFNRGFYTSLIREGLIDEAANNGAGCCVNRSITRGRSPRS